MRALAKQLKEGKIKSTISKQELDSLAGKPAPKPATKKEQPPAPKELPPAKKEEPAPAKKPEPPPAPAPAPEEEVIEMEGPVTIKGKEYAIYKKDGRQYVYSLDGQDYKGVYSEPLKKIIQSHPDPLAPPAPPAKEEEEEIDVVPITLQIPELDSTPKQYFSIVVDRRTYLYDDELLEQYVGELVDKKNAEVDFETLDPFKGLASEIQEVRKMEEAPPKPKEPFKPLAEDEKFWFEMDDEFQHWRYKPLEELIKAKGWNTFGEFANEFAYTSSYTQDMYDLAEQRVELLYKVRKESPDWRVAVRKIGITEDDPQKVMETLMDQINRILPISSEVKTGPYYTKLARELVKARGDELPNPELTDMTTLKYKPKAKKGSGSPWGYIRTLMNQERPEYKNPTKGPFTYPTMNKPSEFIQTKFNPEGEVVPFVREKQDSVESLVRRKSYWGFKPSDLQKRGRQYVHSSGIRFPPVPWTSPKSGRTFYGLPCCYNGEREGQYQTLYFRADAQPSEDDYESFGPKTLPYAGKKIKEADDLPTIFTNDGKVLLVKAPRELKARNKQRYNR